LINLLTCFLHRRTSNHSKDQLKISMKPQNKTLLILTALKIVWEDRVCKIESITFFNLPIAHLLKRVFIFLLKVLLFQKTLTTQILKRILHQQNQFLKLLRLQQRIIIFDFFMSVYFIIILLILEYDENC
jgi:hypothetical protein